MPFSRVAERRIREAIERGDFENLPGAGKPLDLEEYFKTPEDLRMAYSILKSANCAPEEVELLKDISRLDRALQETADAGEKKSLQRALARRKMELAIALERRLARRK